jgi:hypothetical protein
MLNSQPQIKDDLNSNTNQLIILQKTLKKALEDIIDIDRSGREGGTKIVNQAKMYSSSLKKLKVQDDKFIETIQDSIDFILTIGERIRSIIPVPFIRACSPEVQISLAERNFPVLFESQLLKEVGNLSFREAFRPQGDLELIIKNVSYG